MIYFIFAGIIKLLFLKTIVIIFEDNAELITQIDRKGSHSGEHYLFDFHANSISEKSFFQ